MAADPTVSYQDDWLLVVDKPSGLPTQAGRDEGGTPVEDLFTALRRDHPRLALHHRLDQPASGLVLFTRDPRANAAIARAFREHTIARIYRAVLVGEATDATWAQRLDGKEARTDVRVIGRGSGLTAVEVSLHTGRTHQIRRHAALAGRPIAGDRRYGAEAGHRWPRLALHAWRLELAHPITGARLAVESPLPPDLAPLWAEAGGLTGAR